MSDFDFTSIFDWKSVPITVWESLDVQDERGVYKRQEIAGSRRTIQAVITTETDLRGHFMATGDHVDGTVDTHIMPPDAFYTKERDGKQTYFDFEGYTYKVSDIVFVNAMHKCYRSVRFNDTGNNRY